MAKQMPDGYHIIIMDVGNGNVAISTAAKHGAIEDDPSTWTAATRVGENLRRLFNEPRFMQLLLPNSQIKQVTTEESFAMIAAAIRGKH